MKPKSEDRANPTSPGPADRPPAGLLIRLAAMTYDSVLLFGVVFIGGYALLALTRWTYPLSGTQRAVFQAVLFVLIGGYFVYQWSRSGQTLAMKSWHLRLVDQAGNPPRPARAALRYVLAWHLLLPGAVWMAFAGGDPAIDALVLIAGCIVLLLFAKFDARRRMLHDRLSGTRVVHEHR